MTTEINRLVFEADSTDLNKADAALDQLSSTGTRTEASAKKLTASIKAMEAELRRQKDTVGLTEDQIQLYDYAMQGATQAELKHIKALQTSQREYLESAEASARYTNTTTKAGTAMGAMGRRAGMAGIQVQQFVGQVTMGTNPMQALSMQAADLGFVLGAPLVGAVAGITAALVGSFLPALFQSGDAINDLVAETEDWIDVLGAVTQAQKDLLEFDLNQRLEEERDRFADNTEAVSTYERQLQELDKRMAAGNITQWSWNRATTAITEKLVMARAEADNATASIADLEDQLTTVGSTTSEATSKIEEMTSALELQVALLGMNETEKMVTIAERLGATPEQIANIKALREEVDLFNIEGLLVTGRGTKREGGERR